ncbi:hypothetical protein G6O67_003504 [Ophiocordyceps sinensis]|uniref:ABC transporter, transmembrane domain, type 1 n=1 Tax=Ophiocordyceps sinensis TaxID=72228 RepID=A0A8H4PWH3_9HYPO|nr:hypothetical protein G6O67_003504 [Ophiocordyceps sinensis]
MATNATADASFGPQLGLGQLDFTLAFEQTIFGIGPSALLLAAASLRIAVLKQREPLFRASRFLWTKLTAAALLLGLELASLVLWSTSPLSARTHAALATASLAAAAVVAVASLLYTEHRYAYSPSLLLSIYLSVSALLDVASVRSLFLRGELDALGAVASAALALKLVLVGLEEVPKRGPAALRTSREIARGLWNRSVFWWLNATFRRGYSDCIAVDDLERLDHHLDSRHLASVLGRQWNSADKSGKHCLALATSRAFKTSLLSAVIPRLLYTGFSFAQPFLVNTIIGLIGGLDRSRSMAGLIVGATALVYLGMALARCHYMHHTFRLITSVRGGIVALVFAKTIGLDADAAKESAAVTLMSTDASFIELGLAVYLLQRQVGAACFLVLVPAILSSFATARVARGIGPARALWNSKVQKRVSTTSSTLSHAKGIKMMGLGHGISRLIQSLRVTELDSSKTFRWYFVWMNMIANLSDQLTPIIIIAAAVFWIKRDQQLSVAEAFTSLSLIALVSTPIVNIIAAYPTFVSGLACFERIQSFLLLPGRVDYRSLACPPVSSMERNEPGVENVELGAIQTPDAPAKTAVYIKDASFAVRNDTEAVLKNVNMAVPAASLSVVVGPVGSGKSALIKALLGEARILSGSVHMDGGPVAYCDQNAWLRLATIRENILGPHAFDEKWYQTVLWACALEQDMSQLEDGDLTSVGSAGIALSGGQKQRVALARAVYSRARVMLLDDVFSALDRTTSATVFGRLLGHGGLLRNESTTVVLATHATEYLSSADTVITLLDGTVAQQAAYTDVQGSPTHGKGAFEQECPREDSERALPADKPQSNAAGSHLTRKTGDVSLYKFYLDSIGTLLFIGWLVFAAGYIFSGKVPQIWLRVWTENGTANRAAAYFGGYLGFGLLCVLSSGICVYYFMIVVVPKSAQHLHWLLVDAVFKAPLWFFTSTDVSTVLNRFSQDMTLLDQVLPMAVFTTTFDVFNVVAGTALIASGATYVAAVMPLCILAVYAIQRFYLRTSRQMRNLDLEAKSPLYRLLTETAAGLETIRAFGWEQDIVHENLQHLEQSQKPYYTMYCIQRWLAVVLDMLVAAIAVVLVGFALGLPGSASQGSIGLALLNVMEFNQSLSMLVNSWTGLETSLGAIARLKSFLADTRAEGSEQDDVSPPSSWPDRGAIQINSITAKYNLGDAQSQPALRGVSLDIQPGQHVSIVGRTGSGKSSLILTLLRLLDLESGSITIDGVDVSRVSRQLVRSRIITVPQDPVELPGSVKSNLAMQALDEAILAADALATDDDMQRVLARVGLWRLVTTRGGLDGELDNVGLSGGQKQLFSLARALLAVKSRKLTGGIVLMDEPTSSVDEVTEARVRAIIKESLSAFTVITVSHRQDAESTDAVVYMAFGEVVKVTRGTGT